MKREILGGKIHSARVTQANLEYEGSCAIDQDLLDAAGILTYERVHIFDVTTGARFDTYAIPARRGSGTIAMNGAAARMAPKGDTVIIVSYVQADEEELSSLRPVVVIVDEKNRPVKTQRHTLRRKP
jgi:aspartate 1-decarboxylase